MSIHNEQVLGNFSLNLSGALLSSCQLELALQSKHPEIKSVNLTLCNHNSFSFSVSKNVCLKK